MNKLAKQRLARKKNNNAHTKKYEKTKSGFLMRLYRNMKSRVGGVQKKKSHLYKNKALCDKESFYTWAVSSEQFHSLFNQWEKSDYNRRLTPSVDRIDSSKGYDFSNMEWVPFYINCQRGAKSRLQGNSMVK